MILHHLPIIFSNNIIQQIMQNFTESWEDRVLAIEILCISIWP